MKEVLSLGLGVQSTTLFLMSCDGVLPRLDYMIFADPGWESKATYAHLEWCKDKAAKHDIPLHVRSVGNIRDDILEFWSQRKSADGKRHASIPAFVKNPDGSRGLVRRQCTSTYKIEVVEKFNREIVLGLKKGQRWPLDPVIRQWIGISHDEAHRRRTSTRPAIQFWYPLIDELNKPDGLFTRGFTREDCLAWIKDKGYPRPPRSACIGCPFHNDAEWADMKKNRPEEFADACEVDDLIRLRNAERLGVTKPGQLIGDVYLHDSLIPLKMVEFDPGKDAEEGRGMGNDCSGMCGV